MGDTVTITFRNSNIQPEVIENAKTIDIKRDTIVVCGHGYRKVYFKDEVHSVYADYNIGVFVK